MGRAHRDGFDRVCTDSERAAHMQVVQPSEFVTYFSSYPFSQVQDAMEQETPLLATKKLHNMRPRNVVQTLGIIGNGVK